MTHGSDDTRQRLLESAGKVFAEKGFQAATVREICSLAGANLAAVNYHFGDKERLYIEAVQYAHCSWTDEAPPEWLPDSPPAEKLREHIRRMLNHMLDNRRPAWHSQLILREMAKPTQACVAALEGLIRPKVDLLEEVLSELLPAQTPATTRHLVTFSVIGQCLFYRAENPLAVMLVGEEEYRTYDVARLTDHITRFSLAALGHENPADALPPGDEGAELPE